MISWFKRGWEWFATLPPPAPLPAPKPVAKTKAQEVLSAVPAPIAHEQGSSPVVAEQRMSDKGIKLLQQFEGFRTHAYQCSAGVWTIGWGHTSAAGAPNVRKGMVITRQEAEAVLRRDLKQYEEAVRKHVKVKLTQDEFDALVSFCFNIGTNGFAASSVVRYINTGRKHLVGAGLAMWVKAGGKTSKGLVARRKMEADLFYSK
jgi:lysozyme